jgi:hypothetical protein
MLDIYNIKIKSFRLFSPRGQGGIGNKIIRFGLQGIGEELKPAHIKRESWFSRKPLKGKQT